MAKRRLSYLNNWMNGERVGTWKARAGVEELQYENTWIESDKGRPLSLSLPFTPGNTVHRGDNVKYYFDNLLPDSDAIRRRLAQKFHAKSASPFDLLVELGRDCVGAIQLLPSGETPDSVYSITAEPVTEEQIAEILRATVSANQIGQQSDDGMLRISLAGAQEKTAFLWNNEQWCVPTGATPTTHIFKLQLGLAGNVSADINSVENEWLCSKVLEGFGLPVANCDIRTFGDQKVLVVERFDRLLSSDESWIIRLPQEDMCQAKGISPLRKYQSDGGLGISDCMSILDGADSPGQDKRVFFAAQVIFWLLFACDGHSKNFSIRHTSREDYELTPLYDVLSYFPILGSKPGQQAKQKCKLAMAIRGSTNYYLVDRIQRKHFIKHATTFGFTRDDADQLITSITTSAEEVAEYVYGLLPAEFNQELADCILHGMRKQARRLAGMSSQ